MTRSTIKGVKSEVVPSDGQMNRVRVGAGGFARTSKASTGGVEASVSSRLPRQHALSEAEQFDNNHLHYCKIIEMENINAMEATSINTSVQGQQPAGHIRFLSAGRILDLILRISAAAHLSSFPPHSRSADGKERHFSRRNCSHPAIGPLHCWPNSAAR